MRCGTCTASVIAVAVAFKLKTLTGLSRACSAQGLASASLSCTAWRARVASAPELFRYAFWSRFGGRTEGGWWPFFEQEQQLFGHTDWLDLYQATLLGECELETRVCATSPAPHTLSFAGRGCRRSRGLRGQAEGGAQEAAVSPGAVPEGAGRQPAGRPGVRALAGEERGAAPAPLSQPPAGAFRCEQSHQVWRALSSRLSALLKCVQKSAAVQAALERYLRPIRGLLSFGRKGSVTLAGLRREVDHWRRELHADQVPRCPLPLPPG